MRTPPFDYRPPPPCRVRAAAEIERAEADALAEEERVAAREAATREAARRAAELAASLDGGPLDITALGTDGKPTGGRRGHVSFELLESGESSPGADDAGSGDDDGGGGGSSNRSVEYNDGGDSHNGVDADDINDGAYLRRKQMFSQPHEAVRSIEALRAALRSGSSQALVENLAGIMGQDVKLTVPGDGRYASAFVCARACVCVCVSTCAVLGCSGWVLRVPSRLPSLLFGSVGIHGGWT